jgi:hypothetical protein
MVAFHTRLKETIAFLKLSAGEVNRRIIIIDAAMSPKEGLLVSGQMNPGHFLTDEDREGYLSEKRKLNSILESLKSDLVKALDVEADLVRTVNKRRLEKYMSTNPTTYYYFPTPGFSGTPYLYDNMLHLPKDLLLDGPELDANVAYYQDAIALEILTLGLGKLLHLRHLGKAGLAAKANQEVIEHVDELVKLMDNAPKGTGGLLSNIGEKASVRVATRLDDFGPGPTQVFSGVFDSASGKFLMRPSEGTVLLNGQKPGVFVRRTGGHVQVQAALEKFVDVDRAKSVGFTAFYTSSDEIAVAFKSIGVNRKFGLNDFAPESARQAVLDAIQAATGKRVRSLGDATQP